MEKDLSAHRKFYGKSQLIEKDLPYNPLQLFTKWFNDVTEEGSLEEANAMTVSTIGLDGFPKGRVVLLKHINENGFTFFTNYNSEKGVALLNNPKVSLSFFWQTLERQIIIKGSAKKTSSKISDTYFNSRPRASRLGALASNQSEVIDSRDSLDKRMEALEKQFENKEIPRPNFWGGFLVVPTEIEFWQGRENRLHDRIRYKIDNDKIWHINRLSP